MKQLREHRCQITYWRASIIVGLLAACWVVPVLGGDLIPVPDFSDYPIPISEIARPDSPVADWVNVGLLIGALALASYFTIVRRSRRGLFILSIASLIWFGFLRQGCVCPIGATQNVSLALFNPSYAISTTIVLIFVLPLMFTLFFGRTFCAAVCPLGAVQELTAVRPVRVPLWLDHALGLVPYIYLGAAVIYAATNTAFVICRYDPFVAMFRLQGEFNMLIFGACVLMIGVFVGRPYCRYLCPYGAILAVLSLVSKRHTAITPNECIKCQLCEDSCPYGAIDIPTVAQPLEERPAGRRRLVTMLGLLPLLVVIAAVTGALLSIPLSRLTPEVRLAEQIRLEELGQRLEMTDASEAFRNTGQSFDLLYQQALDTRHRFRTLGLWLGAWVGLVVGVKLITLSIRRRRDDYQPDRAKCVSCGRCYWYCPNEQVRLGLISDVSEIVDVAELSQSSK